MPAPDPGVPAPSPAPNGPRRPRTTAARLALLALLTAAPGAAAEGPAAPDRAAPAAATSPALHPMDGPDVDLSFRLREDAVHWRVVANLAFVDEVLGLPREALAGLDEVEVPAYRDALLEHYRETNRCVVDGVEVQPVLAGFRYLPALEELVPNFPRYGARALAQLRLELDYPIHQPPSRVQFVWGTYPVDPVLAGPNGDGPRIEVAGQLYAGGVDVPILFTSEEPSFTWHGTFVPPEERFLDVPEPAPPSVVRVPVVSVLALAGLCCLPLVPAFRRASGRRRLAVAAGLVAVGLVGTRTLRVPVERPAAGLPTEAEALAIFRPLHANIYRAFDYETESEVYDALAKSVDGPLLDELYNQVYRSLVMQEEGGAVARVQAVRPLETEVLAVGEVGDPPRPGFTVEARWEVEGVVRHWGHEHWRTQAYAARYTVGAAGDAWRIEGQQVLEQEVVSTSPTRPARDEPPEPPAGLPREL